MTEKRQEARVNVGKKTRLKNRERRKEKEEIGDKRK
jgi:hypothetical protein